MLTKQKPQLKDFDVDCFIPAVYNTTYFSSVMQDEAALIEWQAGPLDKLIRRHMLLHGIKQFPLLFDAGCGPTVHHMLALAKYAKKLHLADYIPGNMAEIQKWVSKSPESHNWDLFTGHILSAEGIEPSARLIGQRKRELRSKIQSYSLLDLKKPIKTMQKESALLVTSFFVADSATKSKRVFARMTKNAFDIVAPNGLFVASYLGGCERYRVGRKWINSAQITEKDINDAFALAGAKNVTIWRFETPEMQFDGFNHIFAVVAEK